MESLLVLGNSGAPHVIGVLSTIRTAVLRRFFKSKGLGGQIPTKVDHFLEKHDPRWSRADENEWCSH